MENLQSQENPPSLQTKKLDEFIPSTKVNTKITIAESISFDSSILTKKDSKLTQGVPRPCFSFKQKLSRNT
jgi:hypothetical protein